MSPGEETGPDTGPPAGTARAPEADAPPATGADPGTGAPPATGADPEAGAVPVGMIWAQARGGVIGAGGTMPWHLPEDLAHFRRITTGRPVVMGRRTYESFPPRFRPLPGRTNVVITRSLDVAPDGAVQAQDLPEALRRAREAAAAPGGRIWVIGGGGVYREAMHLADLLVVTEIDVAIDGDTHAPPIPRDFRRDSSDPPRGWHTSQAGLRYRIITYRR